MRNFAKLFTIISVFLCIAPIGAFAQTVIFSDDFTSALASRTKWNPDISANVSDGAATITNTHNTFSEMRTATLNPAPSTFTLSFVVKSVLENNSGVLFNQQGNSLNGYLITTFENMVRIFRQIDGSGTSVFSERSFDLNPDGNNKFTISKKGNIFNVFVNDVFLGSFSDSQYDSGNISLFVRPNSTVAFGAISITDEFKEGHLRTSFSDDFNGNGLRYWKFLSNGGDPEIEEKDGMLRVKTDADMSSWQFVDLELGNEFSARVETSFLSGDTTRYYGIILVGTPLPNGDVPMVSFGISGNARWFISSGGDFKPEFNGAIFGAFGNPDEIYVDTLEVKKQAKSPNYEFFANGTLLGTFPVVNFRIASIGLFVRSDLEIGFDNFFAGNENYIPTSIRGNNTSAKRAVSAASFAGIRNGQINLNLSAGNYTVELYNVQGRLLNRVNINAANGINAINLRTDNLSRGVFILNVKQSGTSVLRNKILIQ